MKLYELRKLEKMYEKELGQGIALQREEYFRERGIDFGNLYQEMEMSSRFVDTHRTISYSADTVQLHSHTFYEMMYCGSNSGIQYLIGTERYRLQRGDIVFVPPGVGHKPLITTELAEPYRREVVWMSAEYMEHFAGICPDTWQRLKCARGLFRTAGTRWEGLVDYFHSGVREAEREQEGWQAAVCGNTMQLLVHLGRAVQEEGREAAPAEKPELLDEIMTYVEQNLAKKITLSDTAKRFWVSESTVSQTFKQRMGVSFYRFVTQRRLITAKSMILEGRRLEEVSEYVGFADYSTFYRAFKQEYGIAPRQYRKMLESI